MSKKSLNDSEKRALVAPQTADLLRNFPTERVCVIVQSYSGEHGQVTPLGMSVPDVRPGTIIPTPAHRSPNDYESIEGMMWYFTSDLPVAVAMNIDATMHVELPSDRREVFHLRGEHWSTWHEKNGTYWSVLTIFPEVA